MAATQPSSRRASITPVILSGGSGTRLWPISRARFPKQLQSLVSERTMLQETAARLSPAEGYARPLVVCNHEHRFIIQEQLVALAIEPAAIVLEPQARNTAPAAAAAALLASAAGADKAERGEDTVLVLLPADHVVLDLDAFRAAIESAAALAREGHIATLGVTPTQPRTGYGYIERGGALGREGAYRVTRFTEKPDAGTARAYLASGEHYWNCGIFAFRPKTYLDELARVRPEIVAACREAIERGERDLGFFRLGAAPFAAQPAISIDYAVMEHTRRAVVIPVSFGWSDVGSWASLHEIGARDGDGNVLRGDVIARDVKNAYIRAESSLVAAIGVSDVTVVETEDAVLIAANGRAEEVKELVDRLRAEGREAHADHVRRYRPWGYYQTIDRGDRFQVKHLMVKPGHKLSLQMHHHRAEHWVVVSGTARVTRGEEVLLLGENESTFIPIGMTHRLENAGKIPLKIIEVQSGSYLGEDDIVRFEDAYRRGSDDP